MSLGPLVVGVLALTTASASAVRAPEEATHAQETVVYPTGDPAQDVENVRAAVRGGGRVLLKATDLAGNPQVFHFGDFPVAAESLNHFGSGWVALGTAGEIVAVPVGGGTEYISLGNDVQLLGETVGDAMTTIHGGISPVRNFERKNIPGIGIEFVFGLSNLRIEGIRFTESAQSSIFTSQRSWRPEIQAVLGDRGIELTIDIKRNEFVDLKPALVFRWSVIAALIAGSPGPTNVAGNRVHLTSGKWDDAERTYERSLGLSPRPELWEGFSIHDLFATATIEDNRLEGGDTGMLVARGGSEFVRLAGNTVQLRPEGLVGIWLLANHSYLVERNTVVAPGTNPDGIFILARDATAGINGSTVRHNRVVMDGSWFGAISFYGPGSNNYFGQNTVEGSAAYALGLVADPSDPPTAVATSNAFAGNNIAGFQPLDSPIFGSGAHVFFDVNTRDNVFAGYSGIVRDLGLNNSITGTPHRGHGPGEELREALKKREELLRHFRER
jgi:hypothetical protein